VAAQVGDRVPDERPALESLDGNEARAAFGELEHLERFGELEELRDVIGEHLLGADRGIDRKILGRKDFGMRQVVARADARDPRRDIEHGRGELARDHVRLVALRHGQDHVGVARAGLLEHRGVRGVADDRSQVEPVLQLLEAFRVDVYYGDVVGFGNQAFRDGRPDLSRAKNDYSQRCRRLQ
jgi:hypothetical protein